ncbi:trypsin-like peptidase domain-containing protein [Zooshikella sp. RANM57]|uniref:trypsin-like peptidase domain-containing protein n=1 Tax=Zooshikella sp. RANM57 TaxID=3425863 RepID=UPI003D6FEE31
MYDLKKIYSQLRRYARCICILTFTYIITCTTNAGVYKWVDEQGNIHFSDAHPEESSADQGFETVRSNKTHSRLPTVKVAYPKAYNKTTPASPLAIAPLKVELPDAQYGEISVGTQWAGYQCDKRIGHFVWKAGNSYLADESLQKMIKDALIKNNYRVTDNFETRFLLASKLKKIIVDTCDDYNQGTLTSDAFVHIEWSVFDSLYRKQLISIETDGASYASSYGNTNQNTSQAILSAAQVAFDNFLSNEQVADSVAINIKLLDTPNKFELIKIPLIYPEEELSFKQRSAVIKKTAATIRNVSGHGSGVLISSQGHILTNAHVISEGEQFLVFLNNEEYIAQLLRKDVKRDVALLQTTTPPNMNATVISQALPEVGDTIYVVGSPLSESLKYTVTSGIISAQRERKGLSYYQTDTVIHPGNSGGPVYNKQGELIAISVSGLISKAGTSMGINYLIPINDALATLGIIQGEASEKAGYETNGIEGQAKSAFGFKTTHVAKTKKLPSIKTHSQNTSESTTLSSNSTTSEDKAFDLYQSALNAKTNKEFQRAIHLLQQALEVATIKQRQVIFDELYIDTPYAYGQYLIQQRNIDEVTAIIHRMKKYVSQTRNRMANLKKIEQLETTLQHLSYAEQTNMKATLSPVKLTIIEAYLATGLTPQTLNEMRLFFINNISNDITSKFTISNYDRKGNSIHITFADHSGNETTLNFTLPSQ